MKKQSKRSVCNIYSFFIYMFFITFLPQSLFAQGVSSYIGDRENIGIFGGPATDLSYSNYNVRIFAAVHTPFSLFYSDDTCHTWTPAFPIDSMEYDLGSRGWGGGASRVVTNQIGWVATQTSNPLSGLSAVTVSYDGGYTFQTAIDPPLFKKIAGEKRPVTAMDITDHFCFAALGPYLFRTKPASIPDPSQILIRVDTLAGVSPDSYIGWIAASNDPSGYPIFFVVNNSSQKGRLFKFYGNVLFELGGLPAHSQFVNVFTHPTQPSGDTLFVSALDTLNQEFFIYRSYNGGFAYTNISPTQTLSQPLADVDYSQVWFNNQPQNLGLRLSFHGGLLSDDLGQSWQAPSVNLGSFGIATDPFDLQYIIGSDYRGVLKGSQGIGGGFNLAANIGFASVEVLDFAESVGFYYVATRSGLAYTSKYYDPSVVGYEQWIPPNGQFPVPNVGNAEGVSCVAIDPANPDHVICGYSDGFSVTFTGPLDFTQITPPNWNLGQHLDPGVTDIAFITSTIVIAVTGQKFNIKNPGSPQLIGNIWKSTDGGLNWFVVTPLGFNEFYYGNCIAVSFAGTQPLIYVGTGYADPQSPAINGAIWSSDSFGDVWQFVNNSPVYGSGNPLPVYDIDIDPANNQLIYVCAGNVLARSENGGFNWFNVDIPHNLGLVSSALIDPAFPDSITFTSGRSVLKYSFLIDDADLKFKGLPGEFFSSSSWGSVLGGSNTGVSRIVEAPTYQLNIKMFIEGPFNGTDMNTDLNTLNYLPLTQPFNQPPWNYSGTESVAAIPNADVVDWVLLELRKTSGDAASATATTRFDRKAVFLLKDGTLVDDDGVTDPRFSIILNNNKNKGADKMHGVVYTPGHVEERTSDSLSSAKAIAGTYSYDFTTGAGQAYGGATAHKELAPGVWGMISGDGNQDASVDNLDKNDVWLVQLGSSGYFSGDFNRDGSVDLIDLTDYWAPNAGKGAMAE